MKTLIVLLISFSIVFATEYCNKLAEVKSWEKGISNRILIDDITKEFPKSHEKLIVFLDTLAIENSEQKLLNYIKIKPQVPVVRIRQDSPRFQWEITQGNSKIGIVIHYYKNCINQIMLMNMESSEVYSRRTILSQKEL